MNVLCQSCKHFRTAYYPTMTPFIHGYCDELEYPFSVAVFKEARAGALTAPEHCGKHEKKVHGK